MGLGDRVFVQNDPVNLVDPTGLEITPLGTNAEKALIQSWLDTIGDCCDPEVQERLRALEESAHNYRIKFTDDMVRAGQHKNGLTELDSDLKNPNSTTFWYSPPFFTKRPDTPYFQGPDTLAHELLGHGFDEENGYYGKDEATARAIANKVRDCLGKTRRGGWFDK